MDSPETKPKRKRAPKTPTVGTLVWEAYGNSFFDRYNTMPIRNAMVMGQITQFIKRVGEKDAPAIAEFYCQINDPVWIRMCHPFGWLLKNAETVAVLWAKSQRTQPSIRQTEKSSQIQSQLERIEKGEL